VYDARLDKLADVLVGYSIAVKKNDVVLIRGPALAESLIVACARRVLQAGGCPIVRGEIDGVDEALLKLGKPHQLGFIAASDRLDMETVDCLLVIWGSANTRALTGVDPQAQKARSLARGVISEVFMKRIAAKGRKRLRWVGTQFPCASSAQDAEMSMRDYAEFVFNAGLLHLPDPAAAWRKVRASQQKVCDVLNKAREVRFVTPQGTDLTVGVEGRYWVNADGTANFPDGEVFSAPIEDSTEGVVRYSFPAVYGGREVTDVVLRFRNGKVVEATASKNEAFLHNMLEQDAGAKILGEIAIGTNYSITQYTRNTLFDEKIGGTFHAALGAAYGECRGKNKSALHWDMVCDLRQGGRIEVDGKVISKDGRFANRAWPQPARSRNGG
jgi:aminopeptidase